MIIQIEQISARAFSRANNGIKYRWYIYFGADDLVDHRAMDYGYSYTLWGAKRATKRAVKKLNRHQALPFENKIVREETV